MRRWLDMTASRQLARRIALDAGMHALAGLVDFMPRMKQRMSTCRLIEDVEYARHGTEVLRLDILQPVGPGPHPVLIYFHGGREGDKTIVVDFDKTIAEDRYPSIGRPMPGAKRALERLKAAGYRIVVFSCRLTDDPGKPPGEAARQKKLMEGWLEANGIPFDSVDDGHGGKPHAAHIVDDKALHYGGREGDWDAICDYILSGAKPRED